MKLIGLPYEEHYGFQPLQSTYTAIIHVTKLIRYNMDNGKLIRTVLYRN